MGIKIKLCGIRRTEDCEFLRLYPPDYAGFVFAESRRRVTLPQAEALSALLPSSVVKVGVFVNEPLDKMKAYANAVSVWQLHGDENGEYIKRLRTLLPCGAEIWKAVRVKSLRDIEEAEKTDADKLLLDAFSKEAYGGTGKTADWDLIAAANISKPFFAAGGINASNFEYAACKLQPFGIDLSGGIETNGVKDKSKIAEIMELKAKLNKKGI